MRIRDVISDWITSGLFDAIETAFPERFAWLGSDANLVDIQYLAHSGDKTAGSVIDVLLEQSETETLTSEDVTTLANILVSRFGANWDARYTALGIEYAPLENYSMVEEETPDITRERTLDLLDETGLTEDYERSRTTSVNQDVTTVQNTDAQASRYAFNSNSPVPVDDANGSGSTHTTADAADNTETVTDFGTGGETVAHTGTDTETETGTRTLTRSGNIGVVSSQDMLNQELQVRQYDFIESVFADADKVLTVNVYNFDRGYCYGT